MNEELIRFTSLIGDPVRTMILWNLLDGKAYTATELALCTHTSPQNISIHLNKLVQAELVEYECNGRCKYYRLSRQDVAYAIEAIANLVPEKARNSNLAISADADLRHCRICYDHLAGEIGVQFTEHMLKQHLISFDKKDYEVTNKGNKLFTDFGIEIDGLRRERRMFTHACLDWTERKYHLAGALGSALLEQMIRLDWLRRKKDSRAFVISTKGEKGFYEVFKFKV